MISIQYDKLYIKKKNIADKIKLNNYSYLRKIKPKNTEKF